MLKAKIRPHGGIHPNSHKQLTSDTPIVTMQAPWRLILPLKQHAGAPALPLVKIGSTVKANQLLAQGNGRFSMPIHAPLAGEITGIDQNNIYLKVDVDNPLASESLAKPALNMMTREEIIALIEGAGIVGMGGAMFPTADKLRLSLTHLIDTLIINGSECEPYLTCDDRLMQEQGDRILGGIRYLKQITQAEHVFIGIEENKPAAIAAMESLCRDEVNMEVVGLPALYPMGSEKQLIEAVTGRQVPSGQLSANVGVIVQNVATAIAIFEALRFGRPLTHRVMTISGDAVEVPTNVLAPIGMPISEIVAQCGGLKTTPARIVMGGPMMGRAITDIHAPVTKGTSGVLLLTEDELPNPKASACVRCGRCIGACPMSLTPLDMVAELKTDNFGKAAEMGVMDCLLCGSCAYVCPAAIPLTQYFEWGKQEINKVRLSEQKTARTCANSAARRERLEREAAEKAAAKAAKPARRPSRRATSETTTEEESA